MLPRTAARETITVYTQTWIPEHGMFIYKRKVLHDCIWKQDSQASYKKLGVALLDYATIYIPFDSEYVPSNEFKEYGWTIGIGQDPQVSYIVRGTCPYIFLGDDEYPVTDDTINLDYFTEQVEPFEKKYPYKNPTEIVEHFMGSRNLWYIEVRCQ